mmetsp:Transcript_16898/g.68988  ORF Transcript_16898/g.68988 Transcript_16898/m.68988 type:complete len:202 (-) Transcript_16898:548-1153(-)
MFTSHEERETRPFPFFPAVFCREHVFHRNSRSLRSQGYLQSGSFVSRVLHVYFQASNCGIQFSPTPAIRPHRANHTLCGGNKGCKALNSSWGLLFMGRLTHFPGRSKFSQSRGKNSSANRRRYALSSSGATARLNSNLMSISTSSSCSSLAVTPPITAKWCRENFRSSKYLQASIVAVIKSRLTLNEVTRNRWSWSARRSI